MRNTQIKIEKKSYEKPNYTASSIRPAVDSTKSVKEIRLKSAMKSHKSQVDKIMIFDDSKLKEKDFTFNDASY